VRATLLAWKIVNGKNEKVFCVVTVTQEIPTRRGMVEVAHSAF
jgi:hypothetical protein